MVDTPVPPEGGGSIPTPSLHSIRRIETPEARREAAAFVNAYHSYIKWADRPSRKMYWSLYEGGRLVGVFGLSSAFSRPKAVAEFMRANKIEFNELGNNVVFAMAGHNDRNAGTRFLKLLRKDAVLWWRARYGDTLRAMQTFILPPRTGAVYKADNWQMLGSATAGVTERIRTLYGEDRLAHPEARVHVFRNGETKYVLQEWIKTEPKLMFVRLL